MNSDSKNGPAFGFEISFLPKLTSTKDVENKTTLLHYLVETIERKFPELLNFHEELEHVDRASRVRISRAKSKYFCLNIILCNLIFLQVSLENVQKTLRLMDSELKNLETDLVNSKVPQCEDDMFFSIMSVSFL